MTKLNSFIFPVIFVFVLTLLLNSCSAGYKEEEIIGKWELSEEFSVQGIRIPREIEFFSDGSMQSEWGGKYSIDDNKLNIYYAAMDSYTYFFEINNDALTLKCDGMYTSDETEYIYYKEGADNFDSFDEEENTQYNNALVDECDYLLAEGTNTTGDHYQLVANESQSYDSTQSIGLIKNNEWLIEMTNDSPIIDEDGTVYYFFNFKSDYDKYISPDWNWNTYPTTYRLVSNNCFLLNGYMLWNFETGKTHMLTGDYRSGYIFSEDVTDESYVMLKIVSENTHNEVTYKILDINNMIVIKEFEEGCFYYAGVFSEDLFYAVAYDGDTGFYDKSGNQIIDLSKYNVTEGGTFSDGKATIIAENDTGKEFEITIDKQGNVISEEAK